MKPARTMLLVPAALALVTPSHVAIASSAIGPDSDLGQPVGTYRLQTYRADGSQTGAPSNILAMSGNGRFVVFHTIDRRLLAGEVLPKDSGTQTYVLDRRTGENRLVSRGFDGTPADTWGLTGAQISDDGQRIVYATSAWDLVADDDNGTVDVFLFDQTTGTTTLVDRTLDGQPAQDGASSFSISADGATVAFVSPSPNIVADDPTQGANVFLYDVDSATSALVSRRPDGTPGNGGVGSPDVSADASRVVFSSWNTALVPGDPSTTADVVLFDADAGTTTLVSQTPSGGWPNGDSGVPSISADGSSVAFRSAATDIDGPTGGREQLFWSDLATTGATMVTRGYDGEPGNDGESDDETHISDDGSLVGYDSESSNLVPDDTKKSDVFVYDVATSTNTIVTTSLGLPQGGALSGDGRLVALHSRQPLVTKDVNGHADIYIYRRS